MSSTQSKRSPAVPKVPENPAANTRWRISFYRHDTAKKGFLAFSPTLTSTFHTPERFGWLVFQ